MSNPLPNQLGLTSIADGSPRVAAPVRNNFSALQTAVNALIVALSGGSTGQVLEAVDAATVEWATPAAASARTVGGGVGQSGTISYGTGFTVTKTGTGAYTVTLTPALSTFVAVSATGDTGAGTAPIVTVHSPTVNGFTVNTYTDGNVAQDSSFHFLIIGT